jgi:hypothetical protein
MPYQVVQNQPSAIAAAARLIHLASAPGGCSCGSCEGEQNAGQCPIAQPEFPNFFAGQLVQPADLSGIEQRVFTHEQLRARHTIGWGVACGFRVGFDAAPVPANTVSTKDAIAIAGATLRVEGGYGIDRFGRDVYLADNRAFSLEALFAERDARIKKAMADPWCAIPGCEPTPPTHFCIAVRYKECPDKLVPSYAQQCGTPKTVCEPSRIREDVEIRLFGDNEFPAIPQPPADRATWCGLPAAEQTLAAAFLRLIEIPSGATDVAPSAASSTFSTLAANVASTTAAGTLQPGAAAENSCEDLLHLARPCEPCMDWPWIPLACFTRTGEVVSAPDCRVRRTIYSLQELEALVVRMFCVLVERR